MLHNTFLMVCIQLHIILLDCHKLMVCVKFFSRAFELQRRKFHAACLVRELHTIAPDFNKLMVCVKFLLCAIALLRRRFHAACYFRYVLRWSILRICSCIYNLKINCVPHTRFAQLRPSSAVVVMQQHCTKQKPT